MNKSQTKFGKLSDEIPKPKKGTIERLFLEVIIKAGDKGVTYLDFVGTEITEDNIDQVVQNLRNGMFEAENDSEARMDS